MKFKNKRVTAGKKTTIKRSIETRGKWKSVELDPNIFADEGLEGLVCFEELTNYRLVDGEKAAAKAAKHLEKEKKRTKKRKVDHTGEKPDVECERSEENPIEPVKKKSKKKKNSIKVADGDETGAEAKNRKVDHTGEKPDVGESSGEIPFEPVKKKAKKKKSAIKAADGDETGAKEDGGVDSGNKVDQEAQTTAGSVKQAEQKKANRKQKKTKKSRQILDKEKITEKQIDSSSSLETVKSSHLKVKPQKKQVRNWTDAALSGSGETNSDVSAWKDLFVPPLVLKALSGLGFSSPTPIQALTLPSAIRDRMDILGAAETGSGKTLAFGIPMIHTILDWKSSADKKSAPSESGDTHGSKSDEGEDDNIEASVEDSHSDQIITGSEEDDGGENDQDEKVGCVRVIENIKFDFEENLSSGKQQPLLGLILTPTRELAVQVKHHIDAVAKFTDIKTAILVGGMAQEKQRRMLKRRPEIVIATPGRLWDLIKEQNPHLLNLRQLKCLVIDEADRMVERGHFAELESLLEMLNTTHFNPSRQTFVFSATLTMAHSLPSRVLQKKKNLDKRSKVEILMEKVGIKSKPKVIDLTRKEATVETLTETQIHCQKDEKDFYLYYFLLQYPGRTMVFANSIDCIKRLNALLVILDCNPLPLHANMHQKQRLKNLEKFAERESCVLLTTDVAARGLDIPNIQHVIHYQVPRTSETYVHRSGRTARATKEGLSLLLIGPDDMMNFKKISRTLGKDEDLPEFPVETKCMEAIKERVNLARKIEKIEFHNSREKQHNSWFRQAAEALEVDLDDDLLLGSKKEEADREQQKMVKGMKRHLKHLMSQTIFKNVVKTKYLTKMGHFPLAHISASGTESALSRVSVQQNKHKLRKSLQMQQKQQNQKGKSAEVH